MNEKLEEIEQGLRTTMAGLEAAHARIRLLEEALERFAQIRWPDDVPDNFGITIAQRVGKKKTTLKVADFRRAAAVLLRGSQG